MLKGLYTDGIGYSFIATFEIRVSSQTLSVVELGKLAHLGCCLFVECSVSLP
jgi:hypothetical protein